MKRFLPAFFIFLIWFFLGAWVYTCKIKVLCSQNSDRKSSVIEQPIPENNVSPLPETINTSYKEDKTETATDTTARENIEAVEYNKVLYFGFDSEKHKTDKALKDYILALKTYLETHPDQKISITGHTDNVGQTTDNEWIGMQRAKNAMKYLVSQGIPKDRITLLSRGEAEPIAPNTTKEGRERNRRVEITVN